MPNYLNLPKDEFGRLGIIDGDATYRLLTRNGYMLSKYDPKTRSVTILNSSDAWPFTVSQLLDSGEYELWKPYLRHYRDEQGNLQVVFQYNPTGSPTGPPREVKDIGPLMSSFTAEPLRIRAPLGRRVEYSTRSVIAPDPERVYPHVNTSFPVIWINESHEPKNTPTFRF